MVDVATARSDDEFRAWLAQGALRKAAEWLVRVYAGDVFNFCVACVRDRIAAEDLAQDVFSRALSDLTNYRGDASARTWLFAIARNRCIDHLRRAKLDPWKPLRDAPESDPTDDAPMISDLVATREELRAALASLDEGDRALVVLRFRHGMDYPDLAAAFGVREGTIRMRVSRALSTMRHTLEGAMPDHAVASAFGGARPLAARSPAPGRAVDPKPAGYAARASARPVLGSGMGGPAPQAPSILTSTPTRTTLGYALPALDLELSPSAQAHLDRLVEALA